MTSKTIRLAAGIAALAACTPAVAKDEPVSLTKCDASHGTIAVVDGDTQGWTKYGLGSPRELIAALAIESGCFTPYQPGGAPAAFLMNVIAGDKEEVNKGIEMARSAAVEGLVRSGAASGLLRSTPFGGSALGLLGGLGGRRKTVAAGIRLISPASGQTVVSGLGEVSKSTITFGGNGGNAVAGGILGGAQSAGYANSSDGKMLVEAFIKAFNSVSAQGGALASAAPAPAAAVTAPAAAPAKAAVATRMFASPDANSAVVRSLRAGASLTRTGKRQGLFIEVDDGFGTRGWVSVEDLS